MTVNYVNFLNLELREFVDLLAMIRDTAIGSPCVDIGIKPPR